MIDSVAMRRQIKSVDESMGAAIDNKAITAKLHVSPNGDNSDGSSWKKAYNTLPAALDVASTDTDDLTLILISPHTTYYDIDLTGDPSWAANVCIKGSHRNWTKIMNDHASATSIMTLTGKSCIDDLNFNLGTGNNGVIMTHGGARGNNLQFVGENLTSAKTALEIIGATNLKHSKFFDVHMLGHSTYMTGLKLDKCSRGLFERFQIHECLKGIHIDNVISDQNTFYLFDIGDCNHVNGIAIDIDAGNEQYFDTIKLHHNTLNVDDEVGDHFWANMLGNFEITSIPADVDGITVTANAAADLWGADTEVLAAAAVTKPFRITGYNFEPNITQNHLIRFSADSGTTFFDYVHVGSTRNQGSAAPSGTEFIFNYNTRISCSIMAESGGSDPVQVWLKIQEI